jgi:hypothetical protein
VNRILHVYISLVHLKSWFVMLCMRGWCWNVMLSPAPYCSEKPSQQQRPFRRQQIMLADWVAGLMMKAAVCWCRPVQSRAQFMINKMFLWIIWARDLHPDTNGCYFVAIWEHWDSQIVCSYCHVYHGCVVVWLITLRGFGLVTGFIHYGDL